MNVYTESGFRFDFTTAVSSVIHDKDEPHDVNTFWSGVDFRVFEPQRQIWIEVKSWSHHHIIDSTERRKSGRDFKVKMGADEFRNDIVEKFLGTTAYLYWSRKELPESVSYIVFLDPPNRGNRPLMGPFQDRLRDRFKNAQARSWGKRIKYRVVDFAGFQSTFPEYPVTRV